MQRQVDADDDEPGGRRGIRDERERAAIFGDAVLVDDDRPPGGGLRRFCGTPTSMGTVSCALTRGNGLKRVRLNSPFGSASPAAAGGGFAARHQVLIGSVPVPAGGATGALR